MTQRSRSWTSFPLEIWPRKDHPIVMCHVEGVEHKLSVSTDEGSDQSKMNDAERDEAVSIFSIHDPSLGPGFLLIFRVILFKVRIYKMLKQNGVPPKFIAVLSQYKAQCTEIKRLLEETGIKGANVHSVVEAQGRLLNKLQLYNVLN